MSPPPPKPLSLEERVATLETANAELQRVVEKLMDAIIQLQDLLDVQYEKNKEYDRCIALLTPQ